MRRALTLLEVLLALAIAALLAVAAMSVVGATLRADRIAQAAFENAGEDSALEGLLSRDLLHGVRWRQVGEGVVVETGWALDPADLSGRHVGSTVSYSTRTVAGRPWLVRTQRTDDGECLDELAAPDVQQLSIVAEGRAATGPEGWKGVSNILTVRIVKAGSTPRQREFKVRRS